MLNNPVQTGKLRLRLSSQTTEAKTRGSWLFLLVGLAPKTFLRMKTEREPLNITSKRNGGWNTSEIHNAGKIRLIFQDLAGGKKINLILSKHFEKPRIEYLIQVARTRDYLALF